MWSVRDMECGVGSMWGRGVEGCGSEEHGVLECEGCGAWKCERTRCGSMRCGNVMVWSVEV